MPFPNEPQVSELPGDLQEGPGESLGAMDLDYVVIGGSLFASGALIAWLTNLTADCHCLRAYPISDHPSLLDAAGQSVRRH